MSTTLRPTLPVLAAAVALVCTLSLAAGPARADEVSGSDVVAPDPREAGQARSAAEVSAEERCREIADRLAAEGSTGRDADARIAAARCDIRFERYDQALGELRIARELAPDRGDVDLWEGVARFHRGELSAARGLLDRAVVTSDEDHAWLWLYRGRVQLAMADEREARDVVERRRRKPLRVVEPVDLFHATNPWPQGVLRADAKRDLERVAGYDASGELAGAVREALQQVDAPRGPWIAGGVELLADDTVALLGSGVDTPDEISRDHGFEFAPVITVEGGAELFRAGRWSGGLLGGLYGSFPTESGDLDMVQPTLAAFVDRHISEYTTFRSRYDFSYSWVDGDGFALTNDIDFALHNRSELLGEATLWSRFYYDIFYDDPSDFPVGDGVVAGVCDSTLLPPPFPASAPSCAPPLGTLNTKSPFSSRRERTGWGFLFGGRLRKAFDWNHTVVRGGYTYQHYIPDGAEFHNQSHGIDMGVNTALPLGFALDVWWQFVYQPFRNASAYPEPETVLPNLVWSAKGYRRRDNAFEVGVEVERRILENLDFWVEYRYLTNQSNRGAFDYSRNVVGVGVSAVLF